MIKMKKGYKELVIKDIEDTILPKTIEDVIEITEDLKNGRNNKFLVGSVDLKIGDLKKCGKCGNITDVVEYNGCLSYEKNVSTQCECDRDSYEKWFEPCGIDKCNEKKRCGFHKRINIEKERKEYEEFKKKRDIIKTIFEKCPPVNDGVMELDRIAYMFGHLCDGLSINDSRSYIFSDFMLYCARKGILK